MSFNICIVKNPTYVWDERRECHSLNWNESEGDHHLHLDFDGRDFDELQSFLDLKLPPAEQGEGESYEDYEERLKNEHLKAAKEQGYEMLGRIWYWYESVIYLPSDTSRLRSECEKLKANAQNSEQIAAMDKLITACDEAFKTDSGIFLASD